MKKLSYSLIRIYQIALIFIFIFSFIEAMKLGNEDKVAEGGYRINYREKRNVSTGIVHGVSITSGYNGGAIGMSIISASCLFLVSFLELKLYQQSFNGSN